MNLHPYDWWEPDGSATPVDGRDPRAARARAGARARASGREPLLDPPDGVVAAARRRARERRPADARWSRAPGHLLAHAGAHLHAHRPLRRRRRRQRARDRGRRALPRAGRRAGRLPRRLRRAQPPLPVGGGGDGGRSAVALGRRARRFPPPAARAAPTAAPASCSTTTCCRSTRWCASGAGARSSRRRCRPTWPSPIRWRSGTTRAGPPTRRPGASPRRGASSRAVERFAADPGLARARIKNINAAAALVRIAAAHARRRHRARRGPRRPTPSRRSSEATAIEDGLDLRRAAPVARADAARAGRRAARRRARRPTPSASTARTSRHYPENGWSLAGLAEAQRRQGRHEAAHDATRGAASRAAWRDADVALRGSRF